MSSTADPQAVQPQGSPSGTPNAAPGEAAPQAAELAALRLELDRLDDALHDLLMRRADIVARVGAAKAGAPPLRPGREAAIIRRLVARHQGVLPAVTITRVWRELFSGTTAMQGPYSITVCDAAPGGAFTAMAREHFGALTPLRAHRTPAQAIGEVSAGTAAAAVLPMPDEEEVVSAAWWTALLHKDDPRIHVIARLPFWSPRPEGAPRVQGLVVSTVAPDATDSDRTLLGLELDPEVSRTRLTAALASAQLSLGTTILRRDPSSPVAHALVDVAGFVTEGDPRLAALTSVLRQPVVLGAYATMLEEPR
jgi:chorismate mutase